MSNGSVYEPWRHVVANGLYDSTAYVPPPFRMYQWRPELGGIGATAPGTGAAGTAVTGLVLLGSLALLFVAYGKKA